MFLQLLLSSDQFLSATKCRLANSPDFFAKPDFLTNSPRQHNYLVVYTNFSTAPGSMVIFGDTPLQK